MQQIFISKCLHKSIARLEISKNISLCFNCSSLIIKDELNNEISTIKPPQYSVIQENSIPIFLLIPNKKQYTFQNKTSYLNYRTSIIKNMKLICKNLYLNKKTFFLALDYLDRICSKMISFDFEALKQISKICIILASKFQEKGQKYIEVKNFGGMMHNNYLKDELYLLQLLDYDLHVFTCYDILMDILHCGFLFHWENFSVVRMKAIYQKADNILYMFSESKYYIDMTHKEIALSIIGLIRDILGLEAYNNVIKYVFINDQNNFKKYIDYFNKLKRIFIIKETNNNTYQRLDNINSRSYC